MVRKTEHYKRMFAKTFNSGFADKTHIETHKVTIYWVLFIPIFISKTIVSSNI